MISSSLSACHFTASSNSQLFVPTTQSGLIQPPLTIMHMYCSPSGAQQRMCPTVQEHSGISGAFTAAHTLPMVWIKTAYQCLPAVWTTRQLNVQGQEIASFKPSDIVVFVVYTDARGKEKRATGVTLVKVCESMLMKHHYTLALLLEVLHCPCWCCAC